jgi:predicted dehydrogenase
MRDDQFFPIRGEYGSTWRADVEKAGGGALLEHSIHDLDLFRRLFGEVRSVQCRTRETSGHTGIEDTAQVSFHHEGGHTTTLASIWHDIDSRPSGRSLEVFFERARFTTEQDYFGTITCEIEDAEPVTLSSDQVLSRFMRLKDLQPADEDLRSLAGLGDREFLQAAIAGHPASPDFNDALRSHLIVDSCYQSAQAHGELFEIGS